MDNLTTVRVEKNYIVFDVIAIVISVVGVFMNVIAMVVIYVAVRDKRPVHRLLINLSVTDMLLVMCHSGSIVVAIVKYSEEGIERGRGEGGICTMCICTADIIFDAWKYMQFITLYGILLCLAIDLYYAICLPLHHARCITGRRTNFAIALVWFISIVTGFLLALIGFVDGGSGVGGFCGEYSPSNAWKAVKTTTLTMCGTAGVVTVYLYIRVWVEVRNICNAVHPHPKSSEAFVAANPNRAKKTTITILLVAVTMVIFMAPAYSLALVFPDQSLRPPGLSNALKGWPMLNSVADPIIYSLRMSEIRAGYKQLCTMLPRWKRPN